MTSINLCEKLFQPSTTGPPTSTITVATGHREAQNYRVRKCTAYSPHPPPPYPSHHPHHASLLPSPKKGLYRATKIPTAAKRPTMAPWAVLAVAAPLKGVTVGAAMVVALVGTCGWPSVNSETGAMVVRTDAVGVVSRVVTTAAEVTVGVSVVIGATGVVVGAAGEVAGSLGIVAGAAGVVAGAAGVVPGMGRVTPTLPQRLWAKAMAAEREWVSVKSSRFDASSRTYRRSRWGCRQLAPEA